MVLDNGSTDGSQDWVRQHFPHVRLVELGRNLGFARGNNAGIQLSITAGADYVVLLNNDTRVEPDWLKALIAVAERDPSVAICHAQQRTWDGRCNIQFRFVPEWAEAETMTKPVQDPGQETPCTFASACAMLLRCEALERIGLFDERYFAYVEDVDLALRAWIAGYRVMFVPQSIVYHRGASSSTGSQRMFWGYRNQLTTLLKLYQVDTLQGFAKPILRRWFLTRNRTALRGTLAALAMLPGTLARRIRVQRGRVRPDADFLELSVP
jgi:GT2 family glycosyltransferase